MLNSFHIGVSEILLSNRLLWLHCGSTQKLLLWWAMVVVVLVGTLFVTFPPVSVFHSHLCRNSNFSFTCYLKNRYSRKDGFLYSSINMSSPPLASYWPSLTCLRWYFLMKNWIFKLVMFYFISIQFVCLFVCTFWFIPPSAWLQLFSQTLLQYMML